MTRCGPDLDNTRLAFARATSTASDPLVAEAGLRFVLLLGNLGLVAEARRHDDRLLADEVGEVAERLVSQFTEGDVFEDWDLSGLQTQAASIWPMRADLSQLDPNTSSQVEIQALDENEKEVKIEADGLFAVALQHEIDHLDGKLFIDRISRLKRDLYTRKRKKMLRTGIDSHSESPRVMI